MTLPFLARPLRGRLSALLFIVTAAFLAFAATEMMFSAFMFYDDEGYVLTSLRNFAEHGELYSEVYSQYGPFPYVFYYVVHALGLPLTHTVGRVITLLAWTGTALACAALVGRATASLTARLTVLAGVFIYLWIMASEPTHPGGLIVVITAVLAWLGAHWIAEGRMRAWAVAVGAGVAVLLLTKINIGVFAAFSAVTWFALYHENSQVRRWAPWIFGLVAAVLPFALMRPLLGTSWVQTYALMFAGSGIAAVGAASLGTTARVGWRALGQGALSALVVTIIVLGVIFARGTTPHDLLEGVLLGPLKHPAHFSLAFPWATGTRFAAIISPVLFAVACWLRRRAWRHLDSLVACLRLTAALALVIPLTRFPAVSPDNLVFAFSGPCLWLFLWPLANESPALLASRRWVGLLFLGQCLHAFPVPGSQIAWGTVLVLPLAALGAWPAAQLLAGRHFPSKRHARSAHFVLEFVVAAFAFSMVWRMAEVGARHNEGRDLNLPGAERLRLPQNATALFQILALNAAAHGDVLFSEPGMFSLNLWSGLPTPTLVNVTHWFSLLDDAQQRAIIKVLEAHPRACVIIQREHINYLITHGLSPSGPLHEYLAKNFAPAFILDNFEFSVRRDRIVVPLQLAEIFEKTSNGPANPADAANDTLLKFNLLLPPSTAVASIEVVPMNRPDLAPLLLRGPEARVELTPLNLRGQPIAATQASTWPFNTKRPTAVSIYFDRHNRHFPTPYTLLVLRDTAGAQIALVRFRP
jgi:hypothetical protein